MFPRIPTKARDYPSPTGLKGAVMGAIVVVFYLAFVILIIAGFWKVFTKAGKPGWAAIVPIYNGVVLCQIAGKPGWWVLLMCIPLVNIAIAAIVSLEVAKKFGKGTGFGVGLFLLGFIFYPILGFGSAKYGTAAPQA
jgi:hypothetical protein